MGAKAREFCGWCAKCRILYSWMTSPLPRDALCPRKDCESPLTAKPRGNFGKHSREACQVLERAPVAEAAQEA